MIAAQLFTPTRLLFGLLLPCYLQRSSTTGGTLRGESSRKEGAGLQERLTNGPLKAPVLEER